MTPDAALRRLVEAVEGIRNCAKGIMPIHETLDDLRSTILRLNDAPWTRLFAIYATAEQALAAAQAAEKPCTKCNEPVRSADLDATLYDHGDGVERLYHERCHPMNAAQPASPGAIGESAHDHGNCQLCDALERHREAVEESFKEYQHRAQTEHARLKSQLRAYTDTVILGPHNWRALQDADPVPMPTPEGLTQLLDRVNALTASPGAEVVERVLRGQPEANGEYLHLVECSGDRRAPPGMRGVSCCCRPGATAELRRLLAEQSAALTALQPPRRTG